MTKIHDPCQRLPVTVQRHPDGLRIEPAQPQAAFAAVLVAPISGNPAQQAPDVFREGIRIACILQVLRRDPQVEWGCLARLHVWGRLPQGADQGALQNGRRFQAFPRRARPSDVNEGRQRGVVAGDTQPLQLVQGGAHPLGGQAGQGHQFIGGDPLIRVRRE